MSLMRITSPHARAARSTASVMLLVAAATLPGVMALSWCFGPGVLINIALAVITAVVCEAAIVRLRQRPLGFYLGDYSALVTALLLGIALPPFAPWWLPVVGSTIAIVLAKHLYGGLGYNPFNPAMVAYVTLLISFPVAMTQWTAPLALLSADSESMSLGVALSQVFSGAGSLDGHTMATPLDLFKQNSTLPVVDLYQHEPMFAAAALAGAGWEWVNLGFLLGGLFLLYKQVISWHAPIAMLLSLSLCALCFYDAGSANSGGSPLFHLLSGGTMLGAFFIITDPVTSAVSKRGRLIFGAAIGALIYMIRSWGNYPDAVAFSVLLMNFAAPFIDYYTLPRTYGHSKPRRATEATD